MNKQIKELAEQAKLPSYVLEYGTELCLAPHLEKFAELIVKECVNLCEGEWDGDADTFLSYEAYNECAEAIKEHFGVEE